MTVGVRGDTWASESGQGRSPGSLGLTNSSGDEERKPRGGDTQSHSESSAAVTFRTFHEIRHGILQPARERQQLCAPWCVACLPSEGAPPRASYITGVWFGLRPLRGPVLFRYRHVTRKASECIGSGSVFLSFSSSEPRRGSLVGWGGGPKCHEMKVKS